MNNFKTSYITCLLNFFEIADNVGITVKHTSAKTEVKITNYSIAKISG